MTRRRLIPAAGAMAAGDVLIALGSLALVIVMLNLAELSGGLESLLGMRITLRNVLLLIALSGTWVTVFHVLGCYELRCTRSRLAEAGRVGASVAISAALLALISSTDVGGMRPDELMSFTGVALVASLGGRELRRSLQSQGEVAPRRVLILGRSLRALHMWHTMSEDPAVAYELAGFVDSRGGTAAHAFMDARTLGSLDRLEAILMQQPVDDVCVALPVQSHYRAIQDALLVCERIGVRTHYDADLFDSKVAWPRYATPDGSFVTMHVVPNDMRLSVKRFVDIAGASAALLLLSPVLIAAAIAIKVGSPGQALFAQERYGLGRRCFRMFKFRTMVPGAEQLQAGLEVANEADGPVFKIARDPRVTRVGRLLRRTSIDELPQLLNVLRGEMSLVGPRPLPHRDVARFSRASDMRRFSVRPGITCLWQVSGRSNIGFDDWIRLDLKYIDEWSLLQDLRILVQTIPAVLRGTGAT